MRKSQSLGVSESRCRVEVWQQREWHCRVSQALLMQSALKEASTLLSAASETMRESGLESRNQGSGSDLTIRVVESQLSATVESEDQQVAFLRERQRMKPARYETACPFQERNQSRLRQIQRGSRP